MRINEQVELRDYSAQWRYKVPWGTNTWIDVDNKQDGCRLYVVLRAPNAPQALPWKEVLDISCSIAWGCDTEPEAMDQIWENFYKSAGGVYDTYAGAPRYADSYPYGKFDLTSWLSKYPNVEVVNCYDMGQAEVIFANALGCGAYYTYVEPFGYVNCICPIGRGWCNNPFYSNPINNSNPVVDGDWSKSEGRSAFENHAFATLNGKIYDASAGCVDILDPDDGPIHVPYLLDGDDTWENNYKTRVIDNFPKVAPGNPVDYSFDVK